MSLNNIHLNIPLDKSKIKYGTDREWNKLMKELNTSEGLGGQSIIEINKDRTKIRKRFNKKG